MKPELWGSPLVQEEYQEEKACDKRHNNDDDNDNNNNNNNFNNNNFNNNNFNNNSNNSVLKLATKIIEELIQRHAKSDGTQHTKARWEEILKEK